LGICPEQKRGQNTGGEILSLKKRELLLTDQLSDKVKRKGEIRNAKNDGRKHESYEVERPGNKGDTTSNLLEFLQDVPSGKLARFHDGLM